MAAPVADALTLSKLNTQGEDTAGKLIFVREESLSSDASLADLLSELSSDAE